MLLMLIVYKRLTSDARIKKQIKRPNKVQSLYHGGLKFREVIIYQVIYLIMIYDCVLSFIYLENTTFVTKDRVFVTFWSLKISVV